MTADMFRHVYDYHFAENRAIWDQHIVPLSQEHFIQPLTYSVGSIRNHVVHMMDVDDAWFSDLRGDTFEGMNNPETLSDRDKIRTEWDTVEIKMREYLKTLTDDMLITQPFSGEDKDLYVWQALWQVANHGTDHRAQLLRLLHDCGADTKSQDYVFYAYDNPFKLSDSHS